MGNKTLEKKKTFSVEKLLYLRAVKLYCAYCYKRKMTCQFTFWAEEPERQLPAAAADSTALWHEGLSALCQDRIGSLYETSRC